MRIQVDEDWWKDIFDEVYIQTDARSVCDEELTCQEVNFLETALNLDKSDPILDLCGGQGRHALELSRRGFTDVTVLDYSEYLIELGNQTAKAQELGTSFVQGDARATGLPGERFRFVMVMGSSFGYFVDESENRKFLKETFRLLEPEGTLLLDLPDKDHVLKNFKPFSRHQADEDITVTRTRELDEDMIFSREKVISGKNGCIREQTYCTRLYSPEVISELVCSAGFSTVSLERDFMCRDTDGNDYGFMTHRMVVTAEKQA